MVGDRSFYEQKDRVQQKILPLYHPRFTIKSECTWGVKAPFSFGAVRTFGPKHRVLAIHEHHPKPVIYFIKDENGL